MYKGEGNNFEFIAYAIFEFFFFECILGNSIWGFVTLISVVTLKTPEIGRLSAH